MRKVLNLCDHDWLSRIYCTNKGKHATKLASFIVFHRLSFSLLTFLVFRSLSEHIYKRLAMLNLDYTLVFTPLQSTSAHILNIMTEPFKFPRRRYNAAEKQYFDEIRLLSKGMWEMPGYTDTEDSEVKCKRERSPSEKDNGESHYFYPMMKLDILIHST